MVKGSFEVRIVHRDFLPHFSYERLSDSPKVSHINDRRSQFEKKSHVRIQL